MKPAISLTSVAGALASLMLSTHAVAMSSTPEADPMADFHNSWVGKALSQQRMLDDDSPLAENNILGTHNSYNSEAYRNATRYLDPQQKVTIAEQLSLGARFIELDVHWTAHTHGWPWEWGTDLLLCHSGIGEEWGDLHVGCSLTDRRVSEGLAEVKNWLNNNPQEVIILYFEDHSDGNHQKLVELLNNSIGDKIYASGGCKDIPNALTENQVRQAGKQVVFWKDGGCSDNNAMQQLAFTGLGDIDRAWEDRTGVGAIGAIFTGGKVKRIEAADVRQLYKNGGNIVNLDDIHHDDDRLAAAVWSWDVNEPNNYNGNQHCAVQWQNGRWDDTECNKEHFFACVNSSNQWQVSSWQGRWHQGAQACQQLGNDYQFAAPTNSKDNQALIDARGGISHVWLNASDQHSEGRWQVNR
ncbi:phosphatidylinositol-specific phospholipase C domain-containing protein [Bacterioplanes sanyensis]|uniref:phosphatidylinositol-specific phospholipase C domain-containing protein n=1 Tax=Bacterioplanes sanyensis TaxID=1249553 RepID=UPI0016746072|nr:phosphatidylinositol-specific phospholipase C domain-containing protein [Bacterioplanes sanyensis]